MESIFNEDVTNKEKLFLIFVRTYSNKKMSFDKACKLLSIDHKQTKKIISRLVKRKYLSAYDANTLGLICSGKCYKIRITDYCVLSGKRGNDKLSRTDEAALKLEEMKDRFFVGKEKNVYHFSRVYDNLYAEYTGKNKHSLSPIPPIAKKQRNWMFFRDAYNMIADEEIPEEPYLRSIFEYLKTQKHIKVAAPYPNMLKSKFALDIYTNDIMNGIQQVNNLIVQDEKTVIKNQMESSHEIVSKLMEHNEDLNYLDTLIIMHESLSEYYLAIFPEFSAFYKENKHIIKNKKYESIMRRIVRDDDFADMLIEIYKKIVKE